MVGKLPRASTACIPEREPERQDAVEPLDLSEAVAARRERSEVMTYLALEDLLAIEPDAEVLRAAWEWLHHRVHEDPQPRTAKGAASLRLVR